jgi:hypothetical protein
MLIGIKGLVLVCDRELRELPVVDGVAWRPLLLTRSLTKCTTNIPRLT